MLKIVFCTLLWGQGRGQGQRSGSRSNVWRVAVDIRGSACQVQQKPCREAYADNCECGRSALCIKTKFFCPLQLLNYCKMSYWCMKGCWTEGILMGELDPVSGRLGGLKYDSTSSKSPTIQNGTHYILFCVSQAGLHQRLPWAYNCSNTCTENFTVLIRICKGFTGLHQERAYTYSGISCP